MIKRMLLSVALFVMAVMCTACQLNNAAEQNLSGQDAHPRHQTGLDSQVGDQ